MNKTLIALAALASVGFAATAEAKQDSAERAAFNQTVRNETLAPAYVVEGRNVAPAQAPATGVEPYIRQQIEANERSN